RRRGARGGPCGDGAIPACPCRDRAYRCRRGAAAARRADGAHRRGLRCRRPRRHGAFSQSRDAHDVKVPSFKPTPEHKILDELQLPLAVGRVRYVGEAVAVVIAQTLTGARDAAEAVKVEYDVLPAVTDVEEALAAGAPTLWPEAPGNLALHNEF